MTISALAREIGVPRNAIHRAFRYLREWADFKMRHYRHVAPIALKARADAPGVIFHTAI